MSKIILSAILFITSSFLTSSFAEVGDVYYCKTTAHSRIDFSSNKLTNVYKSLGSIKISFKWEKNNRITFGQKSDWMAGETWMIYHQTAQSFLFHRDHNNDGKPSPDIGIGGFGWPEPNRFYYASALEGQMVFAECEKF